MFYFLAVCAPNGSSVKFHEGTMVHWLQDEIMRSFHELRDLFRDCDSMRGPGGRKTSACCLKLQDVRVKVCSRVGRLMVILQLGRKFGINKDKEEERECISSCMVRCDNGLKFQGLTEGLVPTFRRAFEIFYNYVGPENVPFHIV